MRCNERRKSVLQAELSFGLVVAFSESSPIIFSIKTLACEALKYGRKDVQLDYIQI